MNPDPPRWALAELVVSEPHDGERFIEYWASQGLKQQALRSLDGLDDRTACVAHARMGSVLRDLHPHEFDVFASAFLISARGRRHDPLYWMG